MVFQEKSHLQGPEADSHLRSHEDNGQENIYQTWSLSKESFQTAYGLRLPVPE